MSDFSLAERESRAGQKRKTSWTHDLINKLNNNVIILNKCVAKVKGILNVGTS